MNVVFYLKMADALRDSGLDLIREYIPDSPVYNSEDEPDQYNMPYVPQSPVYQPPSPEYTPSAITKIPGLDLLEERNEEGVHIKFADPPASPHQMVMFPWMFHPVNQPSFKLHLCILLQMQPSSFIQNPLDHHKVCIYQYI